MFFQIELDGIAPDSSVEGTLQGTYYNYILEYAYIFTCNRFLYDMYYQVYYNQRHPAHTVSVLILHAIL